MNQGNDEEKTHTIQRLLDQLLRANDILLRYLLRVLHCTEQHSSSNQMPAFNLVVCTTPSFLRSPISSSPGLKNKFTKIVSLLIQFMIEKCYRIFGEQITSLLGEVSVRCDTRENASDFSCFQMNDSSYDSLENKLNEDVYDPCTDVVNKLGQGSRSIDLVFLFFIFLPYAKCEFYLDSDFNKPSGKEYLWTGTGYLMQKGIIIICCKL